MWVNSAAVFAFAFLVAMAGPAVSQSADVLAPTGTLRIGLLLSNPV
jgi:hypothetical protein